MKCLSQTQPWATLAAIGAKTIETRSWSTDYRGPLAIHASKGFPREYRALCTQNPFYGALSAAMSFPNGVPCYNGGYTDIQLEEPEKYMPRGMIVAVCDLVDVVCIESTRTVRDTFMRHLGSRYNHANLPNCDSELAFGDYSPGRYMWLLSNVQALDKPMPAKGMLGLWEAEIEDPRGEIDHGH